MMGFDRFVMAADTVTISFDQKFYSVMVTRAHIIATAMRYFEMTSVNDFPKHYLLSESLMFESEETRKDILEMVCKEIVLMFVRVKPSFGIDDDSNFVVTNN